ncbi:hypothetical protein [Cupriavidus taiwanensis]|uniref:hypothetical protein n=1 Tax=Cupriavidus taiwanensis TaxID=164546 RepID=UPI000E2F2BAA|nr:hypothetical protein [Cupriavidus taiwanensis]
MQKEDSSTEAGVGLDLLADLFVALEEASTRGFKPTAPRPQTTRRVAKRRGARGSRNGRAVLTAAVVREMRKMAEDGASFAGIGRAFGVHRSTVQKVVRGLRWRHV